MYRIWHPLTQMKTAPPPLKITGGKGTLLFLEDGKTLIDAISSWWVNLHGHGHARIADAIHQQALNLEHVIFAGYTHDPAITLVNRLQALLPSHLTHGFFSDNGSTSVEVALKMAYQYLRNKGETVSHTFISFEGGYHGDTLGVMSMAGMSTFNSSFKDLLFDVHLAPYPATFIGDKNVEEKEARSLERVEYLLKNEKIAAILIEPLIQSSAGMRICRPQFLQQLRRLATACGVLLIYDEVMTGFGRTGELFACLKSETAPDLLCLSKGITGGFLPLALTFCSEEIYHTFYSDDRSKTFLHSHSYTANPIGCAAAIASLDLLLEDPRYREIEQQHLIHYKKLEGHPLVKEWRVCGTIAAFDLAIPSPGYFHPVAKEMTEFFQKKGILIRPLGNVFYLMPPYCITGDELACIYDTLSLFLEGFSAKKT